MLILVNTARPNITIMLLNFGGNLHAALPYLYNYALYISCIFTSLACWLMLERRLCVYNVGLKVDTSQEILTVVMMPYYENVHSCKRHTVVHRAFCFWRFALLFLGLATHYCESWKTWQICNIPGSDSCVYWQ